MLRGYLPLTRGPRQVVLKLLGQHTEPEHISYLLGQAPQTQLGSLRVTPLVDIIVNLDVKMAVPAQTILKLKDVRSRGQHF